MWVGNHLNQVAFIARQQVSQVLLAVLHTSLQCSPQLAPVA
jgi:hypothetical protein